MRNLIFSSLAITACAGAATACPTADDLSGWINIYQDDGDYERFVREGDFIVSTYFDNDGPTYKAVLAKGLYIALGQGIDDERLLDPGDRKTFRYSVEYDDLPMPEAGLSWESQVSELGSEGFYISQRSIVFGTAQTHDIGDCEYQMIPVRIDVDYGDGQPFYDIINYYPELGISVISAFGDADGEDKFNFVRIEKAPL